MTGIESENGTQPGVNPGYAVFQMARALTTSVEHADAATRARAQEKLARWERVLTQILTGTVEYGSRAPVKDAPVWATLEVVTGGFATGTLLAGGPLQEHEHRLLARLPAVPEGEARQALNTYFLTDAGLAELQDMLLTGRYDVALPEEGALLVVAWLVLRGDAQAARELLEVLAPYFTRLRFYPIPQERPRQDGAQVYVQNVGQTLSALHNIQPHRGLLAQKEAVEVWLPLHDRVVALFLETVQNGWPCQHYPADWAARALALLAEYAQLRREHPLCGKYARPGGHYAQLREFLRRCALNPAELSGREVGRIRLMLNRYVEKHGPPTAPAHLQRREQQQAEVSAPLFSDIAEVVIERLEAYPPDEGLDEIAPLAQPVSRAEADGTGLPAGTAIPLPIQRRIERCMRATIAELVARGLLTSGDSLARVLPQVTAGYRAAAISDPLLRQLYTAIYRAFRRRRSLLLFNLEKQVAIEELPWVAAIDHFRNETQSAQTAARQALEEVVALTLTAFPYAILPNKLLQELRALIKSADLDIPLVDEVAADIFMGAFSGKFLAAAKGAADLLEGTLYATYYGIDYTAVRALAETPQPSGNRGGRRIVVDHFAQYCATRAGVSLGGWDPAKNGMIIEQQQILTTQNLAALFVGLELTDALAGQLGEMARQCFVWICRRQQMKIDRWHARLIMLKNTAYAWRQMVFFLSLLPEAEVAEFLRWAEAHLAAQPPEFQARFTPVLQGLRLAANGIPLETAPPQPVARRFLGWSKAKHWLLEAHS